MLPRDNICESLAQPSGQRVDESVLTSPWPWEIADLFLLVLRQHVLDARIGNEPEEGDEDEEGLRDPRADKSEGDGQKVAGGREFSFPVVADGGGEERVGALLFDDSALQDVVGDRGHEKDEAVHGGGDRGDMIFVYPRGGEGEEGEPEEEMEVRPEDAAGDVFGGVEEVMVIVPVNADVDEAEDITQKDGEKRLQFGEAVAVRDFQLQHHDGDDDREDAVAESFEPGGFHFADRGCLTVTAFAERKLGWRGGAFVTENRRERE
jgi:hypothetical protein